MQKTNGLAVAALVVGIVALVFCWYAWVGIIAGILAIIFGAVAKNQIKQDSEVGGAGMATAGLVLGIVAIGLIVLILIFAAAIFTTAWTSIVY
ncbi:MAG: DUF4190 domain-containing protein [Christensenellales bacterium]